MVNQDLTSRSSDPPQRSFKNAIGLMVAQIVVLPVSLVNNAMMARYLGADDFGKMYLVGTIWTFGILFIEWGQGGTLTAMVSRDRANMGDALGSGLLWRVSSGPIVYGVLAVGCAWLGRGRDLQVALALMGGVFGLYTISAAAQDTLRGLERMRVPAMAVVAQQVLNLVFMAPTLVLGGHLRAVLVAQIASWFVVAAWVWRVLRTSTKISLTVHRRTLKALLSEGTPFLVLNLSLALQPNVDAFMLAKLAPLESMGWLAAAKKLVGVLIFPVGALATAFYPTWVRLWGENQEAFRRAVSTGFRASTVLVAPIALGCAIYPDIGIRAFSRNTFGPAEDDLRLLSLFVLALFFSMLLGVAITAAGRSRAWAVCQFGCVVVSAVLDPILVPYFQTHHGNGSLGICVSTVVSEAFMVAGGMWLVPPGILNRAFARTVGLTAMAALAMVATARVLSHVTPFVAAPVAVAAYAVCLWSIGGVDPALVQIVTDAVGRRFRRSADP